MPKIPVIDQNQNVGGVSGQQRAGEDTFAPASRELNYAMRDAKSAGQDVFQAGEAKAAAGANASESYAKIGAAIANIADPLERRYKQLDISNSQVTISNLHRDWAAHALEKIRTGDPSDPDMVQSYIDDFDKNTAEAEAGANTEEGRLYIKQQLASMRAQFGTQVLQGQFQRAGDLQKEQTEASINAYSDTARSNAAMAGPIMEKIRADLALKGGMFGLLPEQQQHLINYGVQKVAKAALDGLGASNPELVQQQLALPADQRNDIFKALAPGMNSDMEHQALGWARSELRLRESERKAAEREAKYEHRAQTAEFSSIIQASASSGEPGAILKGFDMLRSAQGRALPVPMQAALTAHLEHAQKGIIAEGNQPLYLQMLSDATPSGNTPPKLTDPQVVIKASMAGEGKKTLNTNQRTDLLQTIKDSRTVAGVAGNALKNQVMSGIKHELRLDKMVVNPAMTNILADAATEDVLRRYLKGKADGLTIEDMSTRAGEDGKPNPNFKGDITNYRLPPTQLRALGTWSRNLKNTGKSYTDFMRDYNSSVQPPPAGITPLAPPPPKRVIEGTPEYEAQNRIMEAENDRARKKAVREALEASQLSGEAPAGGWPGEQ